MIYSIGNDQLTVAVQSFGAEIISVQYKGKERLWQNEDGSWGGHAPILFPFAGKCTPNIDGAPYPMKRHGLASKYEFTLVSQTETTLRLLFASNAETEKLFPYAFRFYAVFEVVGNALKIAYEVENPSDKPLYAACGTHESYALADSVDNYFLEFEKDEDLTSLLHGDDGTMIAGEARFGQGKRFPLPFDFLQKQTAIFKGVNSRFVTLKKNTGEALASLSFDGFENLMLWHPASSKMICIEVWQNLPDDADGQPPEFSQKEGVRRIEAGERKIFTHEITYF